MPFNLQDNRDIDAICLGRAGMDLYALEENTAFADVSMFRKSVGGSPANIAVGMARLGSKAGIITRLSDDVVGQFVAGFLAKEGVAAEGVSFDDTGTRTSLALTEIRAEGCAVVIYRNNAADLALSESDIDPQFIARAKMLIVSGTALCTEPSRSATLKAIDIAHTEGVCVVLDLDYREYIWASLDEAARVYQQAALASTLVFGNTEEYAVLCYRDGSNSVGSEPAAIADYCLQGSAEAVFVKAGAAGSTVFVQTEQNGPVETFSQASFDVKTRKPFGAGDAYAAAICNALCNGESIQAAIRRGSAAAAIVVAGDTCCECSPTEQELDTFLMVSGA